MDRIKRPGTNEWLLLFILAAGAWLRCYHLRDIPFTHDEFSAILRTHFLTFGELIRNGVMPDGHPAGIQVFLFYWIRLFGISEPVLKLPFIFFGLLSILLTYKIGKEWFNPAAGLVSASFVSFLQFPVMYSQIARPYISGLCFILLMVWFWTRIIVDPGRQRFLNHAGYIVAAGLSVYNHHFSLLMAFLIGITGLFFLRGKNLKIYLLANLAVIILYIPHLPIFFHQLSLGGVEGWLQKPRYDFIIDFLQYVFHFSIPVYILVFLLISLSLYWYEDEPPVSTRYLAISFAWFLLPYLTGFFYSRYVNAVLQYSVLIFSFPFLLFLLSGFFKTDRSLHKILLVSLIALVVIPSLIMERKHYRLFYRAPYSEIVRESMELADSKGKDSSVIILGTNREINPYYLRKFNCRDLPFIYEDFIGRRRHLQEFLAKSSAKYLAYGCISSSPGENYRIIRDRFPCLVSHKFYCGGDFYLFSRDTVHPSQQETFFSLTNTFEPPFLPWGFSDPARCRDSLPISGSHSYYLAEGAEYGPTCALPLREMIRSATDFIDVCVTVRIPRDFVQAWLVMTVTSGEKTLWWNSVPITEYVLPGRTGTVRGSLRVADVDLRHHGIQFMTFIWNPQKLPLALDDFTVSVRTGNPLIYGLYRRVPRYQ